MTSISQGVTSTPPGKHRNGQRQRSSHRAGHFARFFLFALGQQARIHRYERGRQHAFAKKVLQEIRNSKGCVEGIRGIRTQPEIMREHSQPDQPNQAASKMPAATRMRAYPCSPVCARQKRPVWT